MLDFLLAIEHLPAVHAEHFSVRLCFDEVEAINELNPLGRVPLKHLRWRSLPQPLAGGLLVLGTFVLLQHSFLF